MSKSNLSALSVVSAYVVVSLFLFALSCFLPLPACLSDILFVNSLIFSFLPAYIVVQ